MVARNTIAVCDVATVRRHVDDVTQDITYLFELTHQVRRSNFERVPHKKIKRYNIYVDVN